MLIERLKAQTKDAMKAGRTVERDILRLVVGEAQTLEARNNKVPSDEQVEKIIRKMIEGNQETINLSKNEESWAKLVEENKILEEWLPKTLTQEEIEAFFLNSDGPEFEQIQNAKNDGQAMGMAMKTLKSADQKVLGDDVKAVVAKIRTAE